MFDIVPLKWIVKKFIVGIIWDEEGGDEEIPGSVMAKTMGNRRHVDEWCW